MIKQTRYSLAKSRFGANQADVYDNATGRIVASNLSKKDAAALVKASNALEPLLDKPNEETSHS